MKTQKRFRETSRSINSGFSAQPDFHSLGNILNMTLNIDFNTLNKIRLGKIQKSSKH